MNRFFRKSPNWLLLKYDTKRRIKSQIEFKMISATQLVEEKKRLQKEWALLILVVLEIYKIHLYQWSLYAYAKN